MAGGPVGFEHDGLGQAGAGFFGHSAFLGHFSFLGHSAFFGASAITIGSALTSTFFAHSVPAGLSCPISPGANAVSGAGGMGTVRVLNSFGSGQGQGLGGGGGGGGLQHGFGFSQGLGSGGF